MKNLNTNSRSVRVLALALAILPACAGAPARAALRRAVMRRAAPHCIVLNRAAPRPGHRASDDRRYQ